MLITKETVNAITVKTYTQYIQAVNNESSNQLALLGVLRALDQIKYYIFEAMKEDDRNMALAFNAAHRANSPFEDDIVYVRVISAYIKQRNNKRQKSRNKSKKFLKLI